MPWPISRASQRVGRSGPARRCDVMAVAQEEGWVTLASVVPEEGRVLRVAPGDPIRGLVGGVEHEVTAVLERTAVVQLPRGEADRRLVRLDAVLVLASELRWVEATSQN